MKTKSVAVALALILAACAAGTSGDSGGVPVAVVATTTQVGSVAAELGGDAIALTVLLRPGVEAHDFEITPEGGAALEQADIILKSGAGLESWLDDAIATIGGEDRIHDLSEGIEPRTPAANEPGHDEAPGHDDEGAGHGDEVDPHYWLDAANAIVMVENARDDLLEVAPAAADGITERADALIARLEAADAEIRALIDEIPPDRRGLVTDHDALGYFIEAYGLEFVGSVFSSLDVNAAPSAQEIEQLVSEIREHGVRAIFTESAVNLQVARAVAEETDARLITEPLYTDSLGEAGSGADTLDGMLLYNARVIHDGLIGT
jgi:ABC-type Zn uptake system ZnuABC Zn-binding protein ZnuA